MNEEENTNVEPWEEEESYQAQSSENEDNEIETTPETNPVESKAEKSMIKSLVFSKANIGFIVKIIVSVIFSLLALKFILPSSTSDVFYKLYFILFIVFEIGVISCYFFANKSIYLLKNFAKNVIENKGRYSSLNSKNRKVNDVCNAYKKSFLVSDDEDYHKTRANSDLYFGPETWLQDTNPLPIQAFLKIIPGTFIGFGILGTFIGFAGGLGSIDLSNSERLLDSVEQLVGGLRNAFNTSIVGMLASMFCNFVLIHPLFNKLDAESKEFCDYLDNQFFVTEVDAMAIIDENNNKIPFPVVLTQILTRLEGVSSNINSMGLTIGDQVTKSVKETLDKTIEKIIKEEIQKLKTDLNSSIKLLEECQTSLQNAPQQLKEAAIVIENSAKNSSEIFENFSDSLIDIKNAVALLPEDFKNVNESFSSTVNKLSDNQSTLATAISDNSSIGSINPNSVVPAIATIAIVLSVILFFTDSTFIL